MNIYFRLEETVEGCNRTLGCFTNIIKAFRTMKELMQKREYYPDDDDNEWCCDAKGNCLSMACYVKSEDILTENHIIWQEDIASIKFENNNVSFTIYKEQLDPSVNESWVKAAEKPARIEFIEPKVIDLIIWISKQ